MVAHYVRDVGVARSSRVIPTKKADFSSAFFVGMTNLVSLIEGKTPQTPLPCNWVWSAFFVGMTKYHLFQETDGGWTFVEEEVEGGEVGGEAVVAVAEDLVPGFDRDCRHGKLGMEGVAVVIGSGTGGCEIGSGGEGGRYPHFCGAPLGEAEVEIPQEGLSGFKYGEELVPVVFKKGRCVVGRCECPLRTQDPRGAVVDSDFADGCGSRVENRHLKNLRAVSGEDITAVPITLLLVVLASFNGNR